MATGRGNYLTKQAGEYLVAAELSRRGYITTTFTGNVPHYDIVAVDESGGHVLVQVKAITADSWQLNVGDFAEIVFEGDRQLVRRSRPEPYPGMICVMVRLAAASSTRQDAFYVLPWRELCSVIVKHHRAFLRSHGGVRPRSPTSLHTAVKPRDLEQWKSRWDVIGTRVRPTTGGSRSGGIE